MLITKQTYRIITKNHLPHTHPRPQSDLLLKHCIYTCSSATHTHTYKPSPFTSIIVIIDRKIDRIISNWSGVLRICGPFWLQQNIAASRAPLLHLPTNGYYYSNDLTAAASKDETIEEWSSWLSICISISCFNLFVYITAIISLHSIQLSSHIYTYIYK